MWLYIYNRISYEKTDIKIEVSQPFVARCRNEKYNYVYIGKMNVYSFVSRRNRFELLIATFRLQYC